VKILFFANTDWYLYNFRLALAKALREQGVEVVLISPPGKYGEKLHAEGFRWHALPMQRRSLNPFRALWIIFKLAHLYRCERPDLVHHFTIKCVLYGTIAAKIAGIRGCINAITGMGYVFSSKDTLARLLGPFVKSVLKLILGNRRSRLILQNPDDVAALVSQRIISPERVRLIRGSGVNTSRFMPCKKSDCERGGYVFKVLLSTRLLWDKGVMEYVEAARILQNSSAEQMEFLIAGSPDQGSPNSVSVGHIAEWENEGIIKHLGHVDRMAELLSEVDLIVLPTKYGEGVPRILIEAASAGLPIVATDVPGCREIVKHGVNGLLVPARNSNALAEAIRHIAENPSERSRMGAAGRKIAVNEFDEEIVIRDTFSVYRELLPEFYWNKKSWDERGVTVVGIQNSEGNLSKVLLDQ
jgi:glycosyltransferase involved in cell wall biosynthesis